MKVHGNLPSQLTSFIGREDTVALARDRLPEVRLVTLVGPGGCGKTRLGLEIARRMTDDRCDGVFFVDLSGLSDPGLVPGAMVRSLGLHQAAGRDPVEVLVAHLRQRDVLILLDNCEHLVEACASLSLALTFSCPKLWILATSRQPLGVTGELLISVEGLQLPGPAHGAGTAWLEGSEAGRLFVERARLARPELTLDEADAKVIAEICERLDGIPLALELAAARTRMMSFHAVAEGLSDRFRLLVSSGRARLSRHQTLLASIEWSCTLLDERERSLLHRLSVFASGFTVGAVEAVCSGGNVARDDVLGLLTALVEKSLVQVEVGSDRFRLHETMHVYAASALESEGATTTLRDRHLAYFCDLAGKMEPVLWGTELLIAMTTLELDLNNLRAAANWGIDSKQFDMAADLIYALGCFFYNLGLRAEGWSLCERLLSQEELDPSRRGRDVVLGRELRGVHGPVGYPAPGVPAHRTRTGRQG